MLFLLSVALLILLEFTGEPEALLKPLLLSVASLRILEFTGELEVLFIAKTGIPWSLWTF
jgi:hypothetical protein